MQDSGAGVPLGEMPHVFAFLTFPRESGQRVTADDFPSSDFGIDPIMNRLSHAVGIGLCPHDLLSLLNGEWMIRYQRCTPG